MSQVERFAARGWRIGAGNMSRYFLLRNCPRMLLHLLVRHVPCVRIPAGVGAIGSHAMPGGDRPNSGSRSPASPPFLLSSNTGGTANTETIAVRCSLPSELMRRVRTSCLSSTSSSVVYCSLAYNSLRIPWGVPNLDHRHL